MYVQRYFLLLILSISFSDNVLGLIDWLDHLPSGFLLSNN